MVTIINQNENELEIIGTNIPFEKIREFIQQNAKELTEENSEEEETDIVEYIKENYPKWYEAGNKNGLFDEAFVGSIGILAEEFGNTEEEVIDMIMGISADGEFGELGAAIAAEALTIARRKWIEQNKD